MNAVGDRHSAGVFVGGERVGESDRPALGVHQIGQGEEQVGVAEELRQYVAGEGIAAFYSCEPTQKSYYDPKQGRSYFFLHLTEAWKAGGSLEHVFAATRTKTMNDVKTARKETQFPEVKRQYDGEWEITGTIEAVAAWPGEKEFRNAVRLADTVKLPFGDANFRVNTLAREGTREDRDTFAYSRFKTINEGQKELSEQAGWFREYQRAADAGHPLARIDLAYQYRWGDYAMKDEKKAEALEKLAVPDILKAAKANNGEAQYILARMYFQGLGVKADRSEMLNWYTNAADQKHEAAYYALAACYLNGDEGGAWKAGADVAMKWYRKAADQGHTGGMVGLGSLYEKGLDLGVGGQVDKDEGEAVNWYKKAADLGDARGQFGLGSMCETGRGVAKDKKAAVDWYRKAAKQGHDEAKAALERLGK